MASPQSQPTKPEAAKPANGGAVAAAPAPAPAAPARAPRGTKVLTPLGYVNAVESARRRAKDIESRILKQVPEADRARAESMLKANDGK